MASKSCLLNRSYLLCSCHSKHWWYIVINNRNTIIKIKWPSEKRLINYYLYHSSLLKNNCQVLSKYAIFKPCCNTYTRSCPWLFKVHVTSGTSAAWNTSDVQDVRRTVLSSSHPYVRPSRRTTVNVSLSLLTINELVSGSYIKTIHEHTVI